MNFFDKKYNKESVKNDVLFGIVDKPEEKHARTTTSENDQPWDANVHNPNGENLLFIPIDGNIKSFDGKNERSLCDGLLHKTDNSLLAFVEIKNRRKSDIAHAKEQLISTINLFAENHNIQEYRKREAYIADRNHPSFQFSRKEEMNKFFKEFKFRLLCKNDIDVK